MNTSEQFKSNKNKSVTLVTHTDLDGAGCAVLAMLAFGDGRNHVSNLTIKRCGIPDAVNEYLEENREELKKEDLLLITDISCDEKFFSLPNIRLFDHHKTALHLNKFSNATVKTSVTNGDKEELACGTSLFHSWLVNKGYIKPRPFFVEQVRLYDTWDWVKTSYKTARYLNDLVYILGYNEFVKTFASRLEKHDLNELTLFSSEERILLNYNEQNINKYIEKKGNTTRFVRSDKYRIGFVYADMNQSSLGNYICTALGCDIAVMFNMEKKVIELRCQRDDINLSEIAKVFHGGGHRKAAGGSIDEEEMNHLIKYFMKQIGDLCGKDFEIEEKTKK